MIKLSHINYITGKGCRDNIPLEEIEFQKGGFHHVVRKPVNFKTASFHRLTALSILYKIVNLVKYLVSKIFTL
jgi:hypothetical protein